MSSSGREGPSRFSGATVIACRITDLNRRPIAESVQRACARCGEPVIVSVASLAAADAYCVPVRLVCVECAELENHVIIPPTSAQRREVESAGHDPLDWPLKDLWGKLVKRRPPG